MIHIYITDSVLTAKIGTNRSDRSDRAVSPVEALWPVRQGPTGLTGPDRVRVQLGFFIDLDLIIGFLAGQVHPPYKYKGSRPIETFNRSKNISIHYFSFMFIVSIFISKP